MANNLASFAIHVDDIDRARRFYEAVFGWTFEPWGPPGFYLIHTGDADGPGHPGADAQAPAHRALGPGSTASRRPSSVDDLDAVISAVEANGGKITMQKAHIPTVGVLVRFDDPEGNDIGAMAYETAPVTR